MRHHIQTGVSLSVFGSSLRLTCLGMLLLLLPMSLQSITVWCFHCPMMPTVGTCQPTLSECSIGEICAKGSGQYGKHFSYFVKGCMKRSECHKTQYLTYRYHNVSMSFSCCDWSYCNADWCPSASWLLLGLTLPLGSLLSNW